MHTIIGLVTLDFDMNVIKSKILVLGALFFFVLMLPETAAAFRCGNKLVKDGMHELEVIAICGEPTTARHVGFAIRHVDYHSRRTTVPGWTATPGNTYSYPAEVIVTEYVYNLGPRKFMRRILFEDGLVVAVEQLGRGF